MFSALKASHKIVIGFFHAMVQMESTTRCIRMYLCTMKYSKCFSSVTKESGQPNLSTDQFRRMMNIISFEGIIQGMNTIKEKYKNTHEYYKYDSLIFKQTTVLTKLTGNLKPAELMKEMYYLSRESIN